MIKLVKSYRQNVNFGWLCGFFWLLPLLHSTALDISTVEPQLVDSPIDLSFGGTFHDTDPSLHCGCLRGRSPTHTNSAIPPSTTLDLLLQVPWTRSPVPTSRLSHAVIFREERPVTRLALPCLKLDGSYLGSKLLDKTRIAEAKRFCSELKGAVSSTLVPF